MISSMYVSNLTVDATSGKSILLVSAWVVNKAFETCGDYDLIAKKEFESTVILYHSLQNDEIFVFYQTDLKKQFGNVCFDSVLKLLEM